MDKRYQIFVSSTFADLKDERRRVIQTLMEMDCIPAGMELFPAVDEEQWAFIRKIIDDCDYYLLIIGGRYGSTTAEGVSYTEKEYDYAVSKGIKVLALLHEKPDEIPMGKSELDPELRIRLDAFRQKASTGRLVRFWNRAEDMPGLVALSLTKTIKTYPAIGWVRANAIASEEILSQLNQLRQENEQLRADIAESRPVPRATIQGLAGLDESFPVRGHSSSAHGRRDWVAKVSWLELFAYVSPYLIKLFHETNVKAKLCDALAKRECPSGYNHVLEDQDFQTIGIQLKALGLINIQNLKATDNSTALFWILTPDGEQLMLETRAVRTKS